VKNTGESADGVQWWRNSEVVSNIENNGKYECNTQICRNCNCPVSTIYT